MFASRSYLLISILAVASGAPKTRFTKSSTPTWYLPCGENLEIDVNSEEEANANIDVKPYIQKIQIQHKLTLNEYLRQDYEYLYEKVRIGVNEHQYIPNWVPGKKDVNAIRRIKPILNSQMVSVLRSSYVYRKLIPFRFSSTFESLILKWLMPTR